MQAEAQQLHGSKSRFYSLQHGQLQVEQLPFLQLEELLLCRQQLILLPRREL